MCIYWKKKHTCGHISDRPYIEMCRPGCLSNTICTDISTNETLRNSYFPCYPCIKAEARAEAEARYHAQHDAVVAANQARTSALREKHAAEQRAKEERIRREAREKAAREREEENRVKMLREKEEERAKKEGGMWIETGSGKKAKGKKGNGALGFPVLPNSTPSVIKTFAEVGRKENEGGKMMSLMKENGVDAGGRAGTWGPKKILSRKENATVKK
ncbi:hypothetical protein HBH70_178290 [Parastagonospora nodorum]|nr:hypothetical protein HBH46_073000 [Parastagonospora nodorum]KAH4924714.1 hypothetical protein HBI79_160440 [Parastagonospora nodorum]KAH4959689.1 hypothetical protein HBI78_163890 [Parastagonospora nodorum]KAH5035069.1 hypothetical protein HBI74_059150 [Parastagonospora nodorum]KAH5063170.1 hypothetical protein HBH96_061340 [Parastagonospora nodorum]